jgi:hypothetical protein
VEQTLDYLPTKSCRITSRRTTRLRFQDHIAKQIEKINGNNSTKNRPEGGGAYRREGTGRVAVVAVEDVPRREGCVSPHLLVSPPPHIAASSPRAPPVRYGSTSRPRSRAVAYREEGTGSEPPSSGRCHPATP